MILGKKIIPTKRHYTKRVFLLECDICLKHYERKEVQGAMQFCSYECSGLARTFGGVYYKVPRIFVYECAQCSKTFEVKCSPRNTKTGLNFCSIECTNLSKLKNGKLCELSLENRNDTFALERRIETVKYRHGVENVSHLDWVRQKAEATVCSRGNSHWERGKVLFRSKEIWYRSSYERRFIEWADKNPAVIDLVPNVRVWYINTKGRKSVYWADLAVSYISGKRVLVEIKPASQVLLPKNLVKFDAVLSQLSTLGFDEFRVVTEVDLDLLERP